MRQTTDTTLLLGCNLGNKEHSMAKAVDMLNMLVGKVVASSPVKEYQAWGFDCEDSFLNQVVVCRTSLTPTELLAVLWDIEREFGRERGTIEQELAKYKERCEGKRGYTSRTMDIDIIFYGEQIINTPELTIPHPLYRKRPFVLELLGLVQKITK